MGDIHLGSPACHESKLKDTVRWVLDRPDTYVIGMGDYADLILRQDLKRFTASCVKGESTDFLDNLLNEQTDEVYKLFKPLADAGRLLGLVEGNHESSIKKHHSYDIMRELCRRLDVPYLGFSFFYRLTLKKKSSDIRRNLIVYGHHGFGGGRTSGASINKLENMIKSFDADIILSGHDHQKIGKRYVRLSVPIKGEMRVKQKPIVLARTGTFLKTSIPGHTTYSEQFGYPPTDTGVIRIDVRFKGEHKDLDIHVSE
jgi:predicted phosphodiesterase